MPELPEMEAWRRALDDPVSRVPDRAGRAGAHRDAEDVRPAALGARGAAPGRRRAAREAAPVPDRRRRARAARAPDDRGPAALPARPARRARRRRRSGSASQGGGELVLTEAGSKKRAGVWLLTPEAAEAELAHLGPEALGLGAERLGEILARRLAAPALAAPRPARDRRDRPRVGERDPPPREALAVRALDRALRRGGRPARGGDRRGARARASSSASAARRTRQIYRIHNRLGEPCPDCGTPIARVDFEEHTIYYCPRCQTGGRVLKDRRLSRLLRSIGACVDHGQSRVDEGEYESRAADRRRSHSDSRARTSAVRTCSRAASALPDRSTRRSECAKDRSSSVVVPDRRAALVTGTATRPHTLTCFGSIGTGHRRP